MKKLLFAIAGAAAFAAMATDYDVLGFEDYVITPENAGSVVNKSDTGSGGDSKWDCQGDDASTVKAYDAEFQAPSITEPAQFSGSNTQYLNLDTNGSELKRLIPAAGQTIDTGTYIDTLVQFTPSESAPTAADLTGAKLAIWLGVVNDVTNLYVQAGAIDDQGTLTSHAYKLNATAVAGQWYRLTVTALKNVLAKPAGEMANGYLNGFQIQLDGGSPLAAAEDTVFNDTYITDTVLDADWGWLNAETDAATVALLRSNTIFPSLAGMSEMTATLTSVGFKGTGALDDFVVTTEAPAFGPAPIDFTLTWPSGLTAVSYQIGEGEPVAISGNSPFAVPGLVGGETVKLIVQNADGAQKTLTATAADGEGINATGTTFTWADYLGDAVAGAYTIDNFADLDMLRKGVAAGLTTANETFKQTADIDMTSAGAFAGIGAYAKVPTAGTPFLGTYDGQNFTIANVQRAGENTQGIFNQVGPSGVIENLVVSNMYWDSELSGEYGFAIVGNAGGGATLRNLTAAGTFGSASKPSTHNIAGIAVRLSPGATAGAATTVDSCTNNATIYGGYTKLGGINAIVQNQTGFVDGKVVFVNCANNGALVCKRTATDVTGNAGIVGYFSGTNVELTDCYGNGVITNEDGANTDKDGALVGWTYGGTIKDNGGNAAPVGKKMIGTWGSATETGFLYATVDNGVATTVTTLAKDTTYLLEGSVAASETPVFTLAAEGDYIEFDKALGYTFAGTVAGANATNETGNVVRYSWAAASAEDWVPDATEIPAETSAATQYPSLDGTALATADAKELTEWAQTNNVVFADVVSAAGGSAEAANAIVDAFLLNCAPAEVATEKEEFKATITFDASGNPVVTTPDGKDYNGTLKLKGKVNLSDAEWTPVSEASSTYHFYMYELSL